MERAHRTPNLTIPLLREPKLGNDLEQAIPAQVIKRFFDVQLKHKTRFFALLSAVDELEGDETGITNLPPFNRGLLIPGNKVGEDIPHSTGENPTEKLVNAAHQANRAQIFPVFDNIFFGQQAKERMSGALGKDACAVEFVESVYNVILHPSTTLLEKLPGEPIGPWCLTVVARRKANPDFLFTELTVEELTIAVC
ncbi:unnamed protein product [Linum trigynum]|uniref:Uncharacterized protein n=1 Tax=Linum trigynum TaxID=586398 RepID=A0AAV2CIY2_9ROSI